MFALHQAVLFLQLLSLGSAMCPPNAVEFMGNCYTLSTNKISWTRAEETCQAGGAHLTTVLSAFERSAIQDMMSELNVFIDNVWSGGNRLRDGITWEWISGEAFAIQNWMPGFPINDSISNCIMLNSSSVLFSNIDCTTPKHFICKFPNAPIITTPAPGNCGLGYTARGPFCYKVVISPYITFDESEAICRSEGGHLASIHSQDENDFILALASQFDELPSTSCNNVQPHIWIGLSDPRHDRAFEWNDRSVFDYRNWGPGEPDNNCSGDEWCVEFMQNHGFRGIWNDITCRFGGAGYVCKRPASTG